MLEHPGTTHPRLPSLTHLSGWLLCLVPSWFGGPCEESEHTKDSRRRTSRNEPDHDPGVGFLRCLSYQSANRIRSFSRPGQPCPAPFLTTSVVSTPAFFSFSDKLGLL